MSRSLSLRDLQLVPELAHMNEVTLIHPSNDELVFSHLSNLGFDIDYPLEYLPSNHRCMRGKVAVGFRVVGELSCNRAFTNSYLCSSEERVAAYGYTDRSFSDELAASSWTNLDYDSFHESDADEEENDVFESQLQPDWEFVDLQIKQLLEIRDMLRGPPYNSAGSPKLPSEVKTWYENQTFYEEKYL